MTILTKSTNEKKQVLNVFLLGLLMATVMFLPYVIYDKGLFLYYGDFNVQQIPFYQLANEAVRSGNFGWNWHTDLGVNFVGSYSFYLLFSPFFWLTLFFPATATPYLMAPLLVLKFACASVTAFLYIKRFLKNRHFAMLFSFLYAFSGFSMYNVFFNHFHEAIVFFPLLLIGLEKSLTENKWGYFTLGITVNAIVNYWFFIGEAVFVAMYFFVRLTDRQVRVNFKKTVSLAIEVILGMSMSMVVFLPSVLAITGNTRVGADSIINGTGLWYYSNPQRYLGILHSIFFSPDMPALNNWFPDHGGQWSSMAAYIPIFGMVGVLAFCLSKKKSWIKNMLIVSAVFAFVPMLNHLFVMLNNSYYTRWFYMPTLIMVLATAKAFDESEYNPQNRIYNESTGESFVTGDVDLIKGVKYTAIVFVIVLTMVGLTPSKNDDGWKIGTYRYADIFISTALITLIGFTLTLLLLFYKNREKFTRNLTVLILVGCTLYGCSTLSIGKLSYPNNKWITETALPARDKMRLDEDEKEFYRIDIYKGNDNIGMYWNMPNIQTFHSIVPASLMNFYPEIGVKRDVSSKPDVKYVELRALLSVKYLYIKETEEEKEPMQDFVFRENRFGYDIYENINYIPMGFAYDYYIDATQWESLSKPTRSRSMLNSVYLTDDAIERNKDILEKADDEIMMKSYDYEISSAAEERRRLSCKTFEVTKEGFTATTDYDRDRLVFFSVPYEKGWTAYVNGEEATIENASVGFMAVRVPKGNSAIKFVYKTYGLSVGLVISLVSLTVFILLWILIRYRENKLNKK